MIIKVDGEAKARHISVDKVEPLGIGDFNKEEVKLYLYGREHIAGCESFGSSVSKFEFDIRHHNELNVYCLVGGGWLPPIYISGRECLYDRNIVSMLKGSDNAGYQGRLKWFQHARSCAEVKVTTIFSALEASGCGLPSLEDYKERIAIDNAVVVSYLSNAKTSVFSEEQIEIFYGIINANPFAQLTEFLISAAPLIKDRRKPLERRAVVDKLFEYAEKYRVNGRAHALLLSLSCVYRDDSGNSFAHRIIKPSGRYSESKAANCIYDLLFLDLILIVNRYTPLDMVGVTADRWVAMYWCAICPAIDFDCSKFSYQVSISNLLLPSATAEDIAYISLRLAELSPS